MSTSPPKFEEKLTKYLGDIQQANSEAAKAFLFLEFVRSVFGELNANYAEKLFPILEKHLATKGNTLVVKGRVDAFLGNVIIEFKKVLDNKSQKEAESELKRYVSILWTEQGDHRVSYVLVVTDGLRFVSYRPRTDIGQSYVSPESVTLDQIDKLNLLETKPGSAYIWLDRYMIAKVLRPATSQAFSEDFGLNRPSFKDVEARLKQAWEREREAVLYEQWANSLRIVYGSKVDSEDLFIRHTYLAMLAKLLAYSAFSGGALPVSPEQIAEILEGKIFEKWNIHNFLEEDFFSWVARSKLGIEAASLLIERLSSYDLTTIDEDILKSLYQELVDPQARHDLGEYYTPDWLAEIMVERVIDDSSKKVLDPACGSGTFLAATIRRKKELLKGEKSAAKLEVILNTVKGVDVHPLAVILSRTNFLISLGTELLSARRTSISVPVYMADSIRLPEPDVDLYGGVESYKIEAEGKILRLPLKVAENPGITDLVVGAVKYQAGEIAWGAKPELQSFRKMLSLMAGNDFSEGVARILLETSNEMAELIKSKKDTVWAFILKNIYKPFFLSREKFDVLIGNPPWLAYRYVESTDYQSFLKKLILEDYKLLSSERAELITQMELATLFFARCSELYLADDGTISFVMPRSIFVSDQHHNFRKGLFAPKMKIVEAFDLEDVDPLFRVPSCVVSAKKGATKYPIDVTVFSGTLSQRNSKLSEAEKSLMQTRQKYECYEIGQRSFLESREFGKVIKAIESGRRSAYYESFTQGATIVPRSVWFVEPQVHPRLGIDQSMPSLKTSERARKRAKKGYEDVILEGKVESKFLYQVVTGSELAPFCTTTLPIAVLPIEPSGGAYRIVRSDEAQSKGYLGLRNWLTNAESIWKNKRGEKAEIDLYSRLNYQNTLTGQSSKAKFRVLYNTSGTYLVSCIVNNESSAIRTDSSQIKVSGVIADAKVYRLDTSDRNEALFISAVLNAPIVDSLIKPMQSRGQFGERDIHKKVLELPLPKFNPRNKKHMELVKLAEQAQIKAEKLVAELEKKYSGIGKIRQMIKVEIAEEVLKIDKIVRVLILEAGGLPNGLDNFR